MLGRFLSEASGAVAIIVALMLPVLIGAIGLGVETGYWYVVQRQLQNAADVGAYSSAVRMRDRGDEDEARAVALSIVQASGFTLQRGTMQMNLISDSRLEVIVTEQRPRLFTAIFLTGPVAISARAVADFGGGTVAFPVCVLSMHPDAPDAVTLTGRARFELDNCSVAVRSSHGSAFTMSGNSAVVADCVFVVGGASPSTGLSMSDCDEPAVNMDPSSSQFVDQFADHELPEKPSVNRPRDTGSAPLPGNYPEGLNVNSNATFAPGLYYISGGSFATGNNVRFTAEGVTFFLAEGVQMDLGSAEQAVMTAPTSGPQAGMAVFGSRTGSGWTTHDLSGAKITGAVYTPTATLRFRGGSGVDDGCFQIVASRFDFAGNANLTARCDQSSFAPIMGPAEQVRLVE